MRIKGQYILPKILSTVGNAGHALFAGGGHTSAGAYAIFRKFDELQEISDKRLREVTRYAISKKLITILHRGGKSYLELTAGGKKLLGRAAIAELVPHKLRTWDGKWRIVLFDIPEEFKKSRDGFAANLKRMGLIQIQKSAFIFPYHCFEEVEVLADFHQVSRFINCIIAESVSEDAVVQKHFKVSFPK